ncbi:MAG: non-ribosomal peptide synthetase, partial [Gemmatimonadaceae bacterium]
MCYRDLNARANQLARELVGLGAGPDRLIGICLERSATMLVALLAVSKAGAAYLPIDPFLPVARVTYMVRDSEPVALITQESLRESMAFFDGPVLSIDRPAERGTREANDAANLDVDVRPEHLAYIIYTSGSTGTPKGVQVSRGALLNLLWSMREWLGLCGTDCLLAVSTISFDIAGVDIWLPWLVGAQTVLADRQQAADGEQLKVLLAQHAVTFLQATPMTWRLLLAAGWTGNDQMQIVCTGEALPEDLARALAPRVHRLWNLYGPTETTIWSTGFQVQSGNEPVLIGRPVGNTQCYLLDDHHQPVPLGANGELYISGDGLARGYRNRPGLTAEKFVPNPFRPGRKMYRTGDVARYRADGSIECLGRTDDQVKIRGFRIELGEIESVLRRYPGVKQAVVVAREDTPGDKQLVAYLVGTETPSPAATIRSHMKASLPEYMIPAAFVSLDALPLTASGKVDKKTLPPPDRAAMATGKTAVLARTYVEKQLSEIWEEVFSASPVSVEDDFFELGGHSLLALTMMAKIERVFGERLPLNALFESPTIARLAKHIERHQKTVGQHTLVSIQASGSRPPIYWIPGGAALGLFRLRHIVTRLGPDQPVYGLGSGYPKSLRDVEGVEERAAHYLELVRAVQPHGPYCVAGFCAGGRVAYEMAQRLVAEGESVAFLGMINCWFPNYPSGRIRRLIMKLQRFWHKVGEARANDRGLIGFIRERRSNQREARLERETLDSTRNAIAKEGFQ